MLPTADDPLPPTLCDDGNAPDRTLVTSRAVRAELQLAYEGEPGALVVAPSLVGGHPVLEPVVGAD